GSFAGDRYFPESADANWVYLRTLHPRRPCRPPRPFGSRTGACGEPAGNPMIGTIVSFSNQTAAGVVKSADGERFEFDVATVLAYDVAELAVGRPVHFEVAAGDFPKAINISIDPLRPINSVTDQTREIRRLRYMGFDQRGS